MIKFLKMHGLGNDFVIIDQRDGREPLDRDFIIKTADRHFGAGCDQLIVMEPSDKADLFMRIYNTDGSEAESCGNATRCVADIILTETKADRCLLETRAGILNCTCAQQDMITVDMGAPTLLPSPPVEGWGDGLSNPISVSMGNPHCVFFVQDIESVPLQTLGPAIERHEFFPNRTNVEFAEILPGSRIRTRVWERGAGITLACGTGACATIVAAVQAGLTPRTAEILMDGGSLFLEWREQDNHVLMTGPVSHVYEGYLKP